MKINVPEEVVNCISKIGNTTAQKNGYKIYAALIVMSKRQNKHGYFPVPSTFLEKINKRYKRTLDALQDAAIIKPFTRAMQDPDDLFETIEKTYYNVKRRICIKYKFLIDTNRGEKQEIELLNKRKYRWYEIIKNSLLELNYQVKISRDTFGRRVHHTLTSKYKTELKNKGFAVIDAKCSQPKLLLSLMKEQNIVDEKYEEAFKIDFYNYLVNALNLDNREQAKDLFMYFLNSNGYVPDYKIHQLFPKVSKFIAGLKSANYKDAASFLQREESKIWIDDLLENIPSDFALSIHDCLIVKQNEATKILDYCKEKFPAIDFEVTYL